MKVRGKEYSAWFKINLFWTHSMINTSGYKMYFKQMYFLTIFLFLMLLLNLLIADMPHAHNHHKSREIHIFEKVENAEPQEKKLQI